MSVLFMRVCVMRPKAANHCDNVSHFMVLTWRSCVMYGVLWAYKEFGVVSSSLILKVMPQLQAHAVS